MTKIYSNDDIEVVILTGNRLALFKESIGSVLAQSVPNIKVTVINNTKVEDGTEEFVKDLMARSPNVHYYRQPQYVTSGENLETAKSFVTKDYVIFFHDDDIMHPQYIEYVLKLLNKHENVDLICSLLHPFSKKEQLDIKQFAKAKYRIFKTKLDFVRHIYISYCTDGTSLFFPNIVYRSANLNKFNPFSPYGKIGDKPVVIDFIQDGICVQLLEKDFLFYRQHPGQDTQRVAKDPNIEQIALYNKYFMEQMSKDFKSKFVFNLCSVKTVKTFYKWANHKEDYTFPEFLKVLCNKKAVNISALFLHLIPTKLLLKPYNYIEKKYLSKKI